MGKCCPPGLTAVILGAVLSVCIPFLFGGLWQDVEVDCIGS